MFNDSMDPIIRKHYPNGLDNQAGKPRNIDAEIAEYVNPWEKDLQRAVSPSDMRIQTDAHLWFDRGTLTVRGPEFNAPLIGILSVNGDMVSIVEFTKDVGIDG